MAEKSKILTDAKVKSKGLKPGSYADGLNLYLRVGKTGSKSWVFRWQDKAGVSELGLGSVNNRGLKEARDKATELRTARQNGASKDELKKLVNPVAATTGLTFKVAAEAYIASLRGSTRGGKARNEKAVEQWASTLAKWAYPHIGDKRPADVSYDDVRTVLTQPAPKGMAKGLRDLPETQKRVRQRIKVVLDEAAKEEGEPHRYNPALSFKLDTRDPESIAHHAAARWQDVPAIMASLRGRDSTSALLLRYSVLTAARSGEARGAVWSELDSDAAAWTIPAARMKARRTHRVPLCEEALGIIATMAERKHPAKPERVFPGATGGLISDVAVNKTLASVAKEVGIDAHMTAHGFRSSFRQWVAEATSFSPEAAELALAHTPKDKVQAAYQRSDLFDVRKGLMAAWANYCAGKANIIQLAASA